MIDVIGSYNLCTIDDIDFVGRFSLSPSGRYRLIWSDRDPATHTGGARASGHGMWSLLDNDCPILEGRLERPADGQVADNGTFIISDALFEDALAARLHAFRVDGSPILSRDLAANLANCAVSAEGCLAICQTANAPGSPDSCRYILFDLGEGGEIASWENETGWASGYAFDIPSGLVYLIDGNGDQVAYGLDGQMLDRPGWESSRISRGNLAAIRAVFERERTAGGEAAFADLVTGCDVAIARRDIYDHAPALRLRGEILEHVGDLPGALAAFDEALALDPQIGVSRRADGLRRKLDPDYALTGPARLRLRKFERQAEGLGIAHEVIDLERGAEKMWRYPTGGSFVPVELAALDHYMAQGWSGAAAEGGLILTLIKAASFPKLPVRHADTFIEALYAQNVAFGEDRYPRGQLVNAVRKADLARIASNWQIIAAEAGTTPRFYPRVERHHVLGLFEALGPGRLAEIADIFATAAYDLRAGWPDLTLWRGNDIRFVEVKAPSDSLHAKQVRLINTVLRPLGFDTALAEVRPG